MTLACPIRARGALHVGQLVRTTQRYRMLYPKSKARVGSVINFMRGTEARVHFREHKLSHVIDERFIEPVAAGK